MDGLCMGHLEQHSLELPLLLLRDMKGWSTEPKVLFKGAQPDDVYVFITAYLSKNKEIIVSRKGSLANIQALDPNAEFYLNSEKDKIYVISNNVPTYVENWEVYGIKFVTYIEPPPRSIKMDAIVEGIFTGKDINIINPLPWLSSSIESPIDIIRYLRLGIRLHLKQDSILDLQNVQKNANSVSEFQVLPRAPRLEDPTIPQMLDHQVTNDLTRAIGNYAIVDITSDSNNVVIRTPKGLKEVSISGSLRPGSQIIAYDSSTHAYVLRTQDGALCEGRISDDSLPAHFGRKIIEFYMEKMTNKVGSQEPIVKKVEQSVTSDQRRSVAREMNGDELGKKIQTPGSEEPVPSTLIVTRCKKCGGVYVQGGKCPYCK